MQKIHCIINNMKSFFINLLDWIYKKKCYICGNSQESIKVCSNCYNELNNFNYEKKRETLGVSIYCCGLYEKNLQKLIRGLKYHKQKDLAYFQAKFMYEYWQKIQNKQSDYQVIPVPLFKTREKSRKYNHMALVAEEFCKLSGYEINLSLIKRIKDTKPQYKLSKGERKENLTNAFEIDKNYTCKKPVLLLDDIYTTGSTFESIITELKKNEINDIVCFATATPID